MENEKTITSRHALLDINKGVIELHDKRKSSYISEIELTNVTIHFNHDSTIEIYGQRTRYNFTFKTLFLDEINDVDETYIVYNYKSILDFFKGKKTPSVTSGYYKLKKSNDYQAIISNYKLIIKQ